MLWDRISELRGQPVDELHRGNVLQHLAFNCVANGVERVRQLDGWGDLDDDAATMHVVRETFGAEVWPALAAPGEAPSEGRGA